MKNAIKSFGFVIFMLLLAACVMYLATRADAVLGLQSFQSNLSAIMGSVLVLFGVAVRLWAAFVYYQKGLRVISPSPQRELVMSGPFHYSRNPLYIGIILLALGIALLFGSTSGIVVAIVVTVTLHLWAVREENDLTEKFGSVYMGYKHRTPRWLA